MKEKKSGPQNRNYIYFVLQSSKNMHMILIIASVVGFLKEIDICNFPYFEPPNCEWNEQKFMGPFFKPNWPAHQFRLNTLHGFTLNAYHYVCRFLLKFFAIMLHTSIWEKISRWSLKSSDIDHEFDKEQ